MTTRTQLEETLAAQRARRMRSPAPRKRGGSLISALAVLVIMIASGAALFFAARVNASKPSAISTASLSTSPPVSTSTTITVTPIAMQVCTNIPEGRLHVRFAPGDGSEVRGYLAEGEMVQVELSATGEMDSQTIRGDLWLHLSSPVVGWADARYICRIQQ